MYASLGWLPSLVGGGLAFLGFCLVWYRLRRLERLYQRLDEDVPDAPRCQICRRWLFPEPLAAFERLDDDDKRCAGCGRYNGPSDDPPPAPVAVDDAQTQKIVVVSDDDPPPPPVPVAIPEPAPSPPKLVVVSNGDPPPPVPVAIAEPSPSLIRMGTPHPEHCDCDVCSFNRRIAMDKAHAQTLGLHEELAFIRQGLKTLRLTVIDEIDGMNRRISRHIGAET